MKIWAEIKKAINSDLSKPLDTLIKEYLDNSTYGLSALKTLMTGGKIPIVKSVQRGICYEDDNITINAVKPSKCIVILNNAATNENRSAYAVVSGAALAGLSSTTLSIKVKYGVYSSSYVSWQVIEFY